VVRPAERQDLADLLRLERSGFPDPWSAGALRGELESLGALALVACAESPPRVVGYATFRHLADEAELLRLAVDPAWRRRRVGRRLVEAGLERLGARGILEVYLEVRCDNHPARALYEALGFAAVGQRRRYYPDGADAVIYRRRVVMEAHRARRGAAGPGAGH
jgi:ribosomal-protein-alanine N-acetyltransferase